MSAPVTVAVVVDFVADPAALLANPTMPWPGESRTIVLSAGDAARLAVLRPDVEETASITDQARTEVLVVSSNAPDLPIAVIDRDMTEIFRDVCDGLDAL